MMLPMNSIGELCEGKLHAQFDEEVEVSGQTPRWAPPLYSTRPAGFVVAGRGNSGLTWAPRLDPTFDRSAGRRPFLLFPKVPAKSPGVKLATSGCHRRPAPPTANSVSRDSRGPLSGKAATPLIHPFRPPPPSSFISHFPKYMTMVKQPSSNPRKSRHLPKIQILPPLVAEIPRTPCLISSDAIDRGSRYLYMISY